MEYRYPKQEYLDWLDEQHYPSVAAIGLAVLNEVEKRAGQEKFLEKLKDEWFEKPKGEKP